MPAAPRQQHTTLTLITGDHVDYAKDTSGHETAVLLPDHESGSGLYRGFAGPNGYYVIPASAEPYIDSGALDRELFNVRYLANNGYGDATTASLPVIVQFSTKVTPGAVRDRAAKLPGARPGHTLESMRAEGVSVDKKTAHAFWSALASLSGPGRGQALSKKANLASDVAQIMLDRKVKVDLSDSVPLIGAPQAWAAGYDGTGVKVAVLDTGYDPTHPDLAGQVAEGRNFTSDASVADGFGHGTHVASIIAGTGAASGGVRKGVAPGARLLIGKVLDNTGSGFDSWIMDGMEWATASGARLVSMSLGAGPTDGTDPLAQEVNTLTESTGTLFVIAAGNAGPGANTIASPGSASDALTVGATSKTDTLANFSGRGPRFGDGIVKPEITAPGVNIIAARAAGTSLGSVVDANYTSLSGTSMATPHVAGAAAILAQLHPDWTAPKLKAALVASSKDNGYSVWEQGGGRVDVAKAIHQTVLATPAVLSGGLFTDPYQGTTRDLTFTNVSNADVTLSLSTGLKNKEGDSAPEGMLTLGNTSLTVPAGGTATTTVTIDPTLGDIGAYSGRIIATDSSGTTSVVPVGFVKGPKTSKFTIRLVLPKDLRPIGLNFATIRIDDSDSGPSAEYWSNGWTQIPDSHFGVFESTGLVPQGIYMLDAAVIMANALKLEELVVTRPQLDITKDAVETIRETDGVPAEMPLPTNTQDQVATVAYTRVTQSGISYWSGVFGTGYDVSTYLKITPTEKPTLGGFWFTHDHIIDPRQVALRLNGNGSVDLQPEYPSRMPLVPKFPQGLTSLQVATAADLAAGKSVKGKLVFVETDFGVGVEPVLQAAINGGAAGLLAISDVLPSELSISEFADLNKIPVLWVGRDTDQAAELRSVMSGATLPTAVIQSQPVASYEYKLRYFIDHIPSQFAPMDPSKLTRVDTEYHAEFGTLPTLPNASEVDFAFRPEDHFAFQMANNFNVPTSRVEYYTVTGNDVVWWRRYELQTEDRTTDDFNRDIDSRRGFVTQSQEKEQFNASFPVVAQFRPGAQFPQNAPNFLFSCFLCRQGDRLYLLPNITGVNDPAQLVNSPGTIQVGLSVDGQQVPLQINGVPFFTVPTGTGHYDLVTVFQDEFDGQKLAKNVRTEWTFNSQSPNTDSVARPYLCIGKFLGDQRPCAWVPLIFPTLHLPTELNNATPAGREFDFSVTASPAQPSGGAAIAGLTVSASFNDGKTWVPATVRADGNGTFDVSLVQPALKSTSGAVSLRIEAWDAEGNRVVQTIDRAYGLT